MSAQDQSQAQAQKEQSMIFQFSENKQQMQSTYHNEEPWVVAIDVCQILGLSNPTRALESLDDDEKLTLPIVRAGQIREVNCVNESGLYNLIFKSRKAEAKSFRKWVTSEVLPTIRKKGFYSIHSQKNTDFIDARDVPYSTESVLDFKIRTIFLDGVKWQSVNDVNSAIRSSTSSNQLAKKLNAKQVCAQKILIFGNTHPAWFVNELGLQLILSGSRILKRDAQLTIKFDA